jgi:hypothetical protein
MCWRPWVIAFIREAFMIDSMSASLHFQQHHESYRLPHKRMRLLLEITQSQGNVSNWDNEALKHLAFENLLFQPAEHLNYRKRGSLDKSESLRGKCPILEDQTRIILVERAVPSYSWAFNTLLCIFLRKSLAIPSVAH